MKEVIWIRQAGEREGIEQVWKQVNRQLLGQVYGRAERQAYDKFSVQCFGQVYRQVNDQVYWQVKQNLST